MLMFYISAPAIADTLIYESFLSTETNKASYSSSEPAAQLGAAISSGDINGDAINDLIVSAPFASYGLKQWSGMVLVFFGGGGLDEPDLIFHGEYAGDQLGTSITTGDFNSDGIDDIVIGAYNAYFKGNRHGKVYIIYGQSTWGRQNYDFGSYRPDVMFVGHSPDDNFGLSVSTLDMNGDMNDDLLLSAPNASSPDLENTGAVYGYFGPFGDKPSTTFILNERQADVSFYGQHTGEKFGSVISSGNIAGTDKIDIAISAYKSDVGDFLEAGRVYIYKGLRNFQNSIRDPNIILEGKSSNAWFGFAMEVGNLNADHIDDLAISSFPYSSSASSSNVSIYFGDKLFPDNPSIIISEQIGDSMLGASILLDDFNKDGIDDVFIGAPGVSYPVSEEEGSVYALYSGKSDALKSAYSIINNDFDSYIHGENPDEWFGYSLSSLDFNNDGDLDLVVGARYAAGISSSNNGRVYILYGDGNAFGKEKTISNSNDEKINRGEFISAVINKFDIKNKKRDYVDSCIKYKDFCFFEFMSMSSFSDIKLEPELVLYPDVNPEDEYYEEINLGTMLGIVNGYMDAENSPFYPERPVSRIQALKIVLGANGLVPLKYKFELGDILKSAYFLDVNPEISHMWWYPRYVDFAAANNIIDTTNDFRPDENISQSEFENLILRTQEFISSLDEKT